MTIPQLITLTIDDLYQTILCGGDLSRSAAYQQGKLKGLLLAAGYNSLADYYKDTPPTPKASYIIKNYADCKIII